MNREITGEDWYHPMAPVVGSPMPLPRGGEFPVAALEQVAKYAGERRSSAMVVVYRGSVVFERHWANVNEQNGAWSAQPTTNRTNSMSMAKTITAIAVGLAIEDGAIGSVDDLASTYLPEFIGEGREQITIRQLLTMSAGHAPDSSQEWPPSDMIVLFLGANLAQTAMEAKLDHAPGTAYAYSSVAPQLLGLIVERATKRPYADFLSDRLWKPLGASDAAIWLDHPRGTAHTFCCFFATADDYALLGEMLRLHGQINGRQVVPDAWIAAMTTPSPLDPDYGYQTWLAYDAPDSTRRSERTEDFIAKDLFWLDGRDQQRVFVVRSRDLVIVRVGEDTDFNPRGDSGVANWDDAWVVNTLVRAVDESRAAKSP